MIFKPPSPEKLIDEQIYEAKRLHLEHAAAAEFHQAVSEMAKRRLVRLNELKERPQ